MGEVVNLRMARKRARRAEKDAHAQENRVRFGRTKDEKRGDEMKRDLARRTLDAHQRGDSDQHES